MLILSRRAGESIIIGDEVNLTILSVKGRQVRIGIEAPAHISVHREEIYEKIKTESREGGSGAQSDNTAETPDT